MPRLDQRVAALEAQEGLDEARDVIVVGFSAVGEPAQELRTLTNGVQTWHRHDGESAAQFEARACAEAPRLRACIPVLLVGIPDGHASA